MKIGIILRQDYSVGGHPIYLAYEKICSIVENYDGNIIFIRNNEKHWQEKIENCDGIIGQGGDDFTKEDLELVKFIHEKDIPFLGICLSMQIMGCLFNGTLKFAKEIVGHEKHKKGYHWININEESILYKIVNKKTILVNSRHQSTVVSPKLLIGATSKDGLIEEIEDSKKRFFIGVQWHPEDLFSYDIANRKIWDAFFKCCGEYENDNRGNFKSDRGDSTSRKS